MTLSDKIQLVGILSSTVVSFISIFIAIKSLKQSNEMIESSSRPYISIYMERIFVTSKPEYFIIIKNFGSSGALIENFSSDVDLRKLSSNYLNRNTPPFCNLNGTFIAPGQSLHACFELSEALESFEFINFKISYSCGSKLYEDNIPLNLKSNWGNLAPVHSSSNDNFSSVLSLSTYEYLKRNL